MNAASENTVQKNTVVSLAYTLRVDGEVVDQADNSDPLEYLHGHDNIIPGLENSLTGLKVGDSRKVTVSPKDGYGEYDPAEIMDIPRNEFPHEIPLKPGIELEVSDDEGQSRYARIVSVTKSHVRLDFNQPLAGKTLAFDVTVLDVRPATPEELEHGHAHGAHAHEMDEEDDAEFLDFDADDEDDDEEFDFDDDDEFDEDEDDDDVEYIDLEDDAGDWDDEDEDDRTNGSRN